MTVTLTTREVGLLLCARQVDHSDANKRRYPSPLYLLGWRQSLLGLRKLACFLVPAKLTTATQTREGTLPHSTCWVGDSHLSAGPLGPQERLCSGYRSSSPLCLSPNIFFRAAAGSPNVALLLIYRGAIFSSSGKQFDCRSFIQGFGPNISHFFNIIAQIFQVFYCFLFAPSCQDRGRRSDDPPAIFRIQTFPPLRKSVPTKSGHAGFPPLPEKWQGQLAALCLLFLPPNC